MLYDPKWEVPAEIKLEPWQKILLDAADLLKEDGWVQGHYFENKSSCAVGAMLRSSSTASDDMTASSDFLYAKKRMLKKINQRPWYQFFRGAEYAGITSWNDMPERTADEVISTMREAARS